jgi:hypothetical protein
MKLVLTQAIILALTLAASFAHAEGKVIARKDLPDAIASAQKAPKFPGIPSCAKGRMVTTEWPASVDKTDHKCADSSTLYVCAAFGKLSIRCE